MIRPRVLLLDEPLSSLDANLRLEMRGEIRRICREARLTAVYVTHDQREAFSVANRVAVLRAGKVVQCGTPEALYRSPTSRFVAEFMGEANFIEGRFTAPDSVETPLGTFRVRNGISYASGATVTLCIRPEAPACVPDLAAVNSLRVRMADRTYLGDHTHCDLVTQTGHLLKVTRLESESLTGQEFIVTVAPEDIIVLPEGVSSRQSSDFSRDLSSPAALRSVSRHRLS